MRVGTSQAVQWLRLRAPAAGAGRRASRLHPGPGATSYSDPVGDTSHRLKKGRKLVTLGGSARPERRQAGREEGAMLQSRGLDAAGGQVS